ncbi:MAG: binding-protein dependent transport system inner rane protein [Parcubacteria group bacterium]|nr:binding-protein dependent transport system inner rane protein [Parcubacteria group bacterium]
MSLRPLRKKHHVLYYSHHGRPPRPVHIVHRFAMPIVVPLLLVLGSAFIATGYFVVPSSYAAEGARLLAALGASLLRLLIAFVLSLLVGIPLGLWAERSRRAESILLPVFDVLESMPVLAFFPVIILFFLHAGLLEGAAIFIIFFSMVWSIAFSVVGGLKQIPADVKAVGKIFGLTRWQRFREILLPALFPATLTGSILALAAGWNIVIVSEALHAYSPHAAQAHDLFGLGSIIVAASVGGQNALLVSAMLLLVITIALVNLFIWQPLLAHAERFKFE